MQTAFYLLTLYPFFKWIIPKYLFLVQNLDHFDRSYTWCLGCSCFLHYFILWFLHLILLEQPGDIAAFFFLHNAFPVALTGFFLLRFRKCQTTCVYLSVFLCFWKRQCCHDFPLLQKKAAGISRGCRGLTVEHVNVFVDGVRVDG